MAAAHELLVLALVNRQPIHGYDIRQFLDSSYLAHCTSLSTPQIYAVLRRLEERGFVEAREEREANAPPRLVYTVTRQGKEALSEKLNDERLVGQRVLFDFDTVLSAMGHIQGLTTEQSLEVIRNRRDLVERQLQDCQAAWDSTCSVEPAPQLARAVFDHRRGYLDGELRWLVELEKQVKEKGWEWFTLSGSG